jgi:hypothetical protein
MNSIIKKTSKVHPFITRLYRTSFNMFSFHLVVDVFHALLDMHLPSMLLAFI